MRFSPSCPCCSRCPRRLSPAPHTSTRLPRMNELPFGGTNAANLAAMVANPADLAGRGHGVVVYRQPGPPRVRSSGSQTDHPTRHC